MKKLFIAISIVAISSTAGAAKREGKTSDEMQVNATYVIPLTLSLTITAIDFGDVYTDSTANAQTVTANVTGEPNEKFTYTISSDGGYVTLDGSVNTTLEENSVTLSEGAATFDFDVGLDTASISADFDPETVTVSIVYDSIEGTSSS
jgi:hypothetical protein